MLPCHCCCYCLCHSLCLHLWLGPGLGHEDWPGGHRRCGAAVLHCYSPHMPPAQPPSLPHAPLPVCTSGIPAAELLPDGQLAGDGVYATRHLFCRSVNLLCLLLHPRGNILGELIIDNLHCLLAVLTLAVWTPNHILVLCLLLFMDEADSNVADGGLTCWAIQLQPLHGLQLTIILNASAGEEAGSRCPGDVHPGTTSSRKPARRVFIQGESQRYHAVRTALTYRSHARSLVWRSGSPAGRVLIPRWPCYVGCMHWLCMMSCQIMAAIGFCFCQSRWCDCKIL